MNRLAADRRLTVLWGELSSITGLGVRRCLRQPDVGDVLTMMRATVVPYPTTAGALDVVVAELLAEAGLPASAIGTGPVETRATDLVSVTFDPGWVRVRTALVAVFEADERAMAALNDALDALT